MADSTKLTVKGDKEVIAAFGKLSDELPEQTQVGDELAHRLLPDIKARTRKATGTLAGAWIAAGDARGARFTNPEQYAPTQEYGSPARGIEPTQAVSTAFEAHPDAARDTYSRDVERKARRANIGTRGG